jgi:hypothetical protein
VERKNEKKDVGADLISSILWLNPRSVSKPLYNMPGSFEKRHSQGEWKKIMFWTALLSKMKG